MWYNCGSFVIIIIIINNMEKSKTFKVSKDAARFFDEMLKRKSDRKEEVRARYKKGELSS